MSSNTARKLKDATILLVISLGLYLIMGIVFAVLLPGMMATLLWTVATTLVYAFIIWQINLKQNWARIIATIAYVFTLFGTVMMVTATLYDYQNMLLTYNQSKILLYGINICQVIERILEAVAIYFLFTKEVGSLFKRPK
jgi:uncharacterized membrane protein